MISDDTIGFLEVPFGDCSIFCVNPIEYYAVVSICFENADWDRIDTNSIANNLTMGIIENTYLKSIEWSNAVIPQKHALQ